MREAPTNINKDRDTIQSNFDPKYRIEVYSRMVSMGKLATSTWLSLIQTG